MRKGGVKTSFQRMLKEIKGVGNLEEFIERNLRLILLVAALLIFYVENRYAFERAHAELDVAIEERTRVESEMITLHNRFNITSSRTAVLHKLDAQGSKVCEASEPVIVISD